MIAPSPAAPPGPWLAADAAQPLRAWSTHQLDALGVAIAQALAPWRQAWGLAERDARVHCAPAAASLVLREGWLALCDAPGSVWLHQGADAQARLAQLLFDDDLPTGPMGLTVAHRCSQDAWLRLASLMAPSSDAPVRSSPPPSLAQAWSGAVQASLPGTPGWSLLISPAAMQAWCAAAGLVAPDAPPPAAREPLATAGEALGAHTLTLTVTLAGCEIDLRTLTDLRVGDVVRLQHEFNAPATVRASDGRAVFDGWLVAQQGRKAVELTRPPTPLPSPASQGIA